MSREKSAFVIFADGNEKLALATALRVSVP